MYVTPKTISRQNQKKKHNTKTVWYSKYIVVCTAKTYFPPEPKTDTTAQLEKRFLQPTQSMGRFLQPTRDGMCDCWIARHSALQMERGKGTNDWVIKSLDD
jgi:hypothetical protein